MTCAGVIHEDIQLLISQLIDIDMSALYFSMLMIYINIYKYTFFVAKYGENETETWTPGRILSPRSTEESVKSQFLLC